MRFLHTSDWHLGRLFHGVHLTEDQSHVLDQLVEIARGARVDAVLLAGDIYDRAVPPPEAVELLDDVLARLALDVRTTVVAIAGNHDSPHRMGFGARLMRESRLHVVGPVPAQTLRVGFADAHGPVHVYPLPYAEPAAMRVALGEGAWTRDDDAAAVAGAHGAAMAAMVRRIRAQHPARERSVLVAHAFVTGGEGSESERPLSVGGADRVDAGAFEGFEYVALGHLHRPQRAGNRAEYCGSLMKYSFGEAGVAKTVNVVELDAEGGFHVERVSLTPRRDVRCVRGSLAELLEGPRSGESREDYLEVTFTDRGPVLDAIGKLRAVYPNVLHVKRADVELTGAESPRTDRRKLGDRELFAGFFAEVTGGTLTGAEADAFAAVTEAVRAREREGEAAGG